jgi:hypothetical protein
MNSSREVSTMRIRSYQTLPFLLACAVALCAAARAGAQAAPSAAAGTAPRVVSCDEYLVPRVEIKGRPVGQESCKMIETPVSFENKEYRRIDIGVSGTIDGYIPKSGRYDVYFGSNPEFTYPQGGNDGALLYGVGKYEMDKGSAVVMLYPPEGTWNGKMFLTAHGRGRSFAEGTLRAWDKNLRPEDPMAGINKFEKVMLNKGYAVAKTFRSSPEDGGDTVVTLEDGTVFTNRNVTEQPRLIIQLAQVGTNILEKRYGRRPSRTYWYGHSAGARAGRMVNYQPGLNVGPDGKHLIDGILADDSGSGLWVPIVMKNGKNVLFTDEEPLPWHVVESKNPRIDYKQITGAKHKDWFVPQIDIHHLLYVNETSDSPPKWASTNFLENKRINARVLRERGLGSKSRIYEVSGISHSGGENEPPIKLGVSPTVELSFLMEGFIDILDAWVDKGITPPADRADYAELGDVNRDNIIENGPLALPETACPLGVHHIWSTPSGSQSSTGFTAFTGKGLEPFDRRGREGDDIFSFYNYVDMNNNTYRDRIETMTEAWRRLGLILQSETFTRAAYQACVRKSVDGLLKDRFISSKTAKWYTDQAAIVEFPSK